VKVVVTLLVTRMTLQDSEDGSATRIKSGVRERAGPLTFVDFQTSHRAMDGSEVLIDLSKNLHISL